MELPRFRGQVKAFGFQCLIASHFVGEGRAVREAGVPRARVIPPLDEIENGQPSLDLGIC